MEPAMIQNASTQSLCSSHGVLHLDAFGMFLLLELRIVY